MTALGRAHVAVLVDRDAVLPGTNLLTPGHSERHLVAALGRLARAVTVMPFLGAGRLTSWLHATQPDLVFNMTEHVEGDRHKDVHICALLDLHGIAYTGPGPKGLVLCRDKALSKLVAERHGFATPRFVTLDARAARLPRDLPLPAVVKPRYGDSSDGISQSSLVRSRPALRARLRVLGGAGTPEAICEAFVDGREMVVGIVGRRLMPPRELIVAGRGAAPRLFSSRMKHDAAYRRRWGVRIDFAHLTSAELSALREAALATFTALEMRDFGRFDVKLTPGGQWVFLEANPNPALVPHRGSFSGTWAGMSYDTMIATIARAALQRG